MATIEGGLDAAGKNLDDAREIAGDESQREGDLEEAVADKGSTARWCCCRCSKRAGARTSPSLNVVGRNGRGSRRSALRCTPIVDARRTPRPRVDAPARRAHRTPFAHAFETGGMRRTHLRKHENIAKRLLVHIAGLNLALLMRTRFGVGKPRCLQGRAAAFAVALLALLRSLRAYWRQVRPAVRFALETPIAVVHFPA